MLQSDYLKALLMLIFLSFLSSFVYANDAQEVKSAAQSMTLRSVLEAVLSQHPDVALSRIDTAIVATDEASLEALLDPVLSGRLALSDDRSPIASDFQPKKSQFSGISGQYLKPLASGSSFSASIDYSRNSQSFASPFAAQLAKINPAYRGGLSLSYRVPLLRGADRPEYNQALLAVKEDIQVSRLQRQLIARGLSLQTLAVFFNLAADASSLQLAQAAVERANRLFEYQGFRARFGLIEDADKKQVEALLAARDLELQQAKARLRKDQVSLNRLMLSEIDTSISVSISDWVTPDNVPKLTTMIDVAMVKRPEFEILDAQFKAAESRLHIAQNSEKMQLDVVAEVGTQSLESKAADGVSQSLDPQDRFVGLSLELSDTAGRYAARANIRKAELNKQRIQAQRKQFVEQVRDELAMAITTLETGVAVLAVSKQRADAEKKKYQSEMTRYREGRSDTATVVQFEGDLQRAVLEATLQQQALLYTDKQLAWAKGVMLEELGLKDWALDETGQSVP